jgi:NAD(P)H-flavin reductase
MAITSEALPVPAPADPMRPEPFRVNRVVQETADTFTLTLARAEGDPVFAFRPGQYNMLFAFGVGEVPISMSGRAGSVREIVHTIRAVGPATRTLRRVKRGDVLGLRGPFGTHWPVDEAQGHDVLVVAGGIGLAPLRPAILHLLAHRKRYGRVARSWAGADASTSTSRSRSTAPATTGWARWAW